MDFYALADRYDQQSMQNKISNVIKLFTVYNSAQTLSNVSSPPKKLLGETLDADR